MHVLVTAATRHEGTREIGETIARGLRLRGLGAEARPIDSIISVEDYDAAVVGSAVYMGRWLKSAREFVEINASKLTRMPVWLFSSGPLGPAGQLSSPAEPTDAPLMVRLSAARDHRVFAGRLDTDPLSFRERLAVSAVRASEDDRRDWDAIDAFIGDIAAELSAEQAPAPVVTGRHRLWR